MNQFVKALNHHRLLIFGVLCYLFLVLQNPYQPNNVLSDLSPFPDSLMYINPARSLTSGFGLKLEREDRTLNQNVPPLYSLILSPFEIGGGDPRSFYFANVILGLISIILFHQLLNLTTSNRYLKVFSLILFATNFYLFFIPNFAMAENLVIPLFLGGLTLLLKPATRTNSFIAGLIAVSFYATKFVLLPLTGTYLVVYALKVLLERRSLKSLFPLSAAVTGSFLILYSFEKLYQGQELLTVVTSAFNAYLTNSSTDPQIARSITGEQYFNQSYFELNIKQYMFGLIGGELVNFGQDHPLFPWFVGFIGTGGLVGNLFIKKWRLFFASLLLIVIVNVFFICTFYATDGRYIIYTIPLILLSFSITADRLMQWLSHKKKLIIGYLVLAFFGLSYVGMSFPQFRQTITEHITGRDQPNSHYQFIQTINQAPISSDQPILITGLFPYYIDLFSKKYELLPLSPRGYLMESVETIYGISPQIPLKEIYQQALRDHRAVYVSNYQVNDWNKRYLHADFETLSQEFTLTLVQEGCGGECNLYQLSLHEL